MFQSQSNIDNSSRARLDLLLLLLSPSNAAIASASLPVFLSQSQALSAPLRRRSRDGCTLSVGSCLFVLSADMADVHSACFPPGIS